MQKVLISIPDQLASRMRATIPDRKRSNTIAHLIEIEVSKRERDLYNAALEVEKDDALKKEMREWDITTKDGIDDESW